MPDAVGLECPVCSGSDLESWGRKRGYDLFHCRRCDHRFADVRREVFSEDPRLFLEMATHGALATDDAYYAHLSVGERPGSTTAIMAGHAISLVHGTGARGSWLDVGAGTGYLVKAALSEGFDATGIEPGGWGQIGAREKGVRIVHGFLTAGTFTRKFDIVSATDVVEHQADPLAFLKLLAQYVGPGGRLLFSVPYADSLECKLLGARWNMVGPPNHSQFFSRKSLDVALAKVGFHVVAHHQYHVHHRLAWLLRWRLGRGLLDAVIPGAQIVCVAAPIPGPPVGMQG